MTMSRNKPRTSLTVETLEDRRVPAVNVWLSYGVLNIHGDSWDNKVEVNPSGSNVVVSVWAIDWLRDYAFAAGQVSSVRFFGYDGHDNFINNVVSLPCYADGGNGNDYLEGYGGNDEFWGRAGHDTMYAYGGNDDLYGGVGNDVMYGQAGLDGLYGGADADSLYGGTGADRFLVMTGHAEHKDAAAEDAVLWFRNYVRIWNDPEVEMMDSGLKLLHRTTNNDNLLETSWNGAVTFWRGGAHPEYLAVNYNNGNIVMYDGSFGSTPLAGLTTIHEVAHNWDDEHTNWSTWLQMSGWIPSPPHEPVMGVFTKSLDLNWKYLTTSTFARHYGRTNPYEDFTTSWESYFTYRYGLSNVFNVARLSSAKSAHLDAFFNSLR
jgi:hypothetical protein